VIDGDFTATTNDAAERNSSKRVQMLTEQTFAARSYSSKCGVVSGKKSANKQQPAPATADFAESRAGGRLGSQRD
jgi:hypothetical protein